MIVETKLTTAICSSKILASVSGPSTLKVTFHTHAAEAGGERCRGYTKCSCSYGIETVNKHLTACVHIDCYPTFTSDLLHLDFTLHVVAMLKSRPSCYCSLAKKGPVSNIRPPPIIASISCKGLKFTPKSVHPIDLVRRW